MKNQLEEFNRQLMRGAAGSELSLRTVSKSLPQRLIPWTCCRRRSRSWPWPIPISTTKRGKRTSRRPSGSSRGSRHGGCLADGSRHDKEPLPSDDALSHAGNFLWQLTGEKPDPETAKDLDTALVLHADHSFNASTFACREVASTQAHMYAAVAAGVGALSGSLHGGANAQVMKMLMELKDEKDVPGWVKKQLDSGRKIMGMGHAVYKTTDPRAQFLKEMCFRLGQEAWSGALVQSVRADREERCVRVREAGQDHDKAQRRFLTARRSTT